MSCLCVNQKEAVFIFICYVGSPVLCITFLFHKCYTYKPLFSQYLTIDTNAWEFFFSDAPKHLIAAIKIVFNLI